MAAVCRRGGTPLTCDVVVLPSETGRGLRQMRVRRSHVIPLTDETTGRRRPIFCSLLVVIASERSISASPPRRSARLSPRRHASHK